MNNAKVCIERYIPCALSKKKKNRLTREVLHVWELQIQRSLDVH